MTITCEHRSDQTFEFVVIIVSTHVAHNEKIKLIIGKCGNTCNLVKMSRANCVVYIDQTRCP